MFFLRYTFFVEKFFSLNSKFSKFLSLKKNLSAFSSSHSFIFLSQFLWGFSSKDLISIEELVKLRFEFLQYKDCMSSNLWFSSNSTSSAFISLHYPVIPKLPLFKYLPALPAICPISAKFNRLNFFPSNFLRLEK